MTVSAPRFVERQHTARSLALQVLLDCLRSEPRTQRVFERSKRAPGGGDAFIQEVLDRHLATVALSAADRRLATQLSYGVLRRRATLDALLAPLITRQLHQVESWLREALRLGAFQLVLLTHIPPHAALHETVELAGAFGRPRAKGFLNAVLRKLAAMVTAERAKQPAADAIPFEHGSYRKLSRPVLPEPGTHPVEYFAAAFAFPRWLAERWLGRWGWDECVRLGFWFAGPAPVWVRCNTLRTTRADLLAAFAAAGLAAEPGNHPQAVRLNEPAAIRELPGYEQGWFAVQDESAMQVASALAPAPGNRVLDLCAAPGSKTTHMAESMQNQGSVIACDVDERRLEPLQTACRRLGITIVETRRLDPKRSEEPPPGPFDAILVDAPCSNTGVLGRRPEVRWRLKERDFERLVPLQTRLLLQAAERVRPGGVIVYSTCSIEPEENRQVVTNVLHAIHGLQIECEEEQRAGQPADGCYWARLRRRSE
jgi:16S rRNA (cytosine967-C5)-methyltransferase